MTSEKGEPFALKRTDRSNAKKMSGSKKAAIGVAVVCGVLLSQLAVFWGLDVMAKRALLPEIAFEQLYKLHGATDDLQGDFALSANGRYLAWSSAGILQVDDLVERRNCYVGTETSDVFVWLPDRSCLLFLAGNQLYSLNLEGGMRVNRETEATLPDYTYLHMGVSTYTNVIYLMGKTPAGEHGVLKMDLIKNMVWLKSPPGAVCSRIYVSNKTGAVMVQGETETGPQLFCLEGEGWVMWKPEPESESGPGTTDLDFPMAESIAENTISYVLWGADDRGFYVGAMGNGDGGEKGLDQLDGQRQGKELKLLYYPVEISGTIGRFSIVLWEGSLPASSEFLSFAVGAGFLMPAEAAERENFLVLKMIWGANRKAGPMETYTLGVPLLQEETGQRLYRVFASNGLTYLEIRGGVYCWRLLAR